MLPFTRNNQGNIRFYFLNKLEEAAENCDKLSKLIS